jgi:branched-chain amino acid transport system ATP-binding protein
VSTAAPVLQTDHLIRRFGGVRAVNDVSIEVAGSTVTGIIGPNGAGKTTLLNIVAGADQPDGGRVSLDGEDVTGRPAHEIAHRGVVRTFQRAGIFPTLSAIENVLLSTLDASADSVRLALRGPGAWSRVEAEAVDRAWALLDRFGLGSKANDLAGSLSGGQKRLVELTRAVLMRPRLLLLDEPTAGVNPSLIPVLLDFLRTMTGDGMTVVMIEHDLAVIEDICDTVVFMARGAVVASGGVTEVLRDPAVQAVAHGY